MPVIVVADAAFTPHLPCSIPERILFNYELFRDVAAAVSMGPGACS